MSPSCGKIAQPIEASSSTTPPSTRYGRRSALRRRPTSAAASSSHAVPSDRTTNSSPPTRATVSDCLGRRPRVGGRSSLRTSLPASWPRMSLTPLNPSRSIDEERERLGRASRAGERLGDPVVEQGAVGEPGERSRSASRCAEASLETSRCVRCTDEERRPPAIASAAASRPSRPSSQSGDDAERDHEGRSRRPDQAAWRSPTGRCASRTGLPPFLAPRRQERARAPQ